MRISDWSSDVCSSDLLEPQQTPFVARLHHLTNQCGGRDETNGQALLACGQTETERDMRLSRAAGAKRNDVLASLDPLTSGQFQYLHLVELRDGGEVETIKAFGDREFGGLDPTFDLAAIPFDHLPFGKPEQIGSAACREGVCQYG